METFKFVNDLIGPVWVLINCAGVLPRTSLLGNILSPYNYRQFVLAILKYNEDEKEALFFNFCTLKEQDSFLLLKKILFPL